MSDKELFKIELTEVKEITFAHLNDLKSWISEEDDYWSVSRDVSQFHALSTYIGNIRSFSQSLSEIKQTRRQSIFDLEIDDVLNQIKSYFGSIDGGFFCSHGKTGPITKKILLEGANLEAFQRFFTNYEHQNRGLHNTMSDHRINSAFWANYHGPNHETLEAVTSSLNRTTNTANEVVTKANKSLAASRSWQERWEKKLDKRVDITARWYANRASHLSLATKAKLATQRKTAREELDALKTTYETDLQLRAPARYWATKAEKHSFARIGYVVLVVSRQTKLD